MLIDKITMTVFQNIIRVTSQVLSREKFLTLDKISLNAERYYGNKLDVPSPPKRPLSAYMIFCKENRKKVLQENPSLSNPEQIKILAKRWGLLPDDMKKPYEISARESTRLYGIEHKNFYEGLTEEQKEELTRLKAEKIESRRIYRQKKALRESGLPKAPNSSYSLFVQSEAKKKPIKNASEFIKKVAELWNNLPEDSKKTFEKQAEEERMQYALEMKEWHTRMLLEGNKKILKAYEDLKGKGKSLDIEEEVISKMEVTANKISKTETSKN